MFCGLTCSLSWKMLHVHLKRMYVLLWVEMLWKYQLNPSGLVFQLRPLSLLVFCPEHISIDVCGVLKSPTMTVLPSHSHIHPYFLYILHFIIYINTYIFHIIYYSYIFRCFYISCIDVYKGYTLWLDWSADHYEMLSLCLVTALV